MLPAAAADANHKQRKRCVVSVEFNCILNLDHAIQCTNPTNPTKK